MELAIKTGRPAFAEPVYVGAPTVEKEVSAEFYKKMGGIFERNHFTNNGPLVRELEAAVAQMHGVNHCVAVCNATIGQLLVLKALELEGEIIMPSFTFIATAHSCLWNNIRPVFCDIDPKTLMIDAKKVEELITEKTCAVFGVHLFGNICEVEELASICREYKLKLVFDAAHAFLCTLGGRLVGGFGNAEILSFHATKFFSTFEGGAVLTNDTDLNNRVRFLKNFGFRDYDDVGFLGINGKMSEPAAAMGLSSLPMMESRAGRFKEEYAIYCEKLGQVEGINILAVGENGHSNFRYVVILVDEEQLGISRDLLYRILWKENVIARRYFYPGCHRLEPYISLNPDTYKYMTH